MRDRVGHKEYRGEGRGCNRVGGGGWGGRGKWGVGWWWAWEWGG